MCREKGKSVPLGWSWRGRQRQKSAPSRAGGATWQGNEFSFGIQRLWYKQARFSIHFPTVATVHRGPRMDGTISGRSRHPPRFKIFLVRLSAKLSYSDSNFERIDPGIRNGKSGIGDVEIAGLQAPCIGPAEKMGPERRRWREIYLGRPRRHLPGGKQGSTAQFKIRHDSPAGYKIPFEIQRIQSYSVGSIVGLKNEVCGNSIHCILKSTSQQSRQMRIGQNPSIAQPRVPDASIAATARDRMSAGSPYLKLGSALLGTGLGPEVSAPAAHKQGGKERLSAACNQIREGHFWSSPRCRNQFASKVGHMPTTGSPKSRPTPCGPFSKMCISAGTPA